MRLAVYTNPVKDNNEIKKSVEEIASSLGFVLDDVNPEVVFACGGDGTILRAIHAYSDKSESISFFGANFGNMGFFYEYDRNEVENALLDLKNKKLVASKHKFLLGKMIKDNKVINEFFAINEIRIENNSKPLLCDVYLNKDYFESYVGTGLLVSSSIGSTAYNLTLSGAAVLSNFETLQLTKVQPSKQSECFKSSLVMDINNVVSFDFSKYGHEVLLGYDFVVKEHCIFDSIEISSSKKYFNLLSKKESKVHSRLKKLFD